MKYYLIAALVVTWLGFFWYTDNAPACYLAKGRLMIERVVDLDGKPLLGSKFWWPLESDRRACTNIFQSVTPTNTTLR